MTGHVIYSGDWPCQLPSTDAKAVPFHPPFTRIYLSPESENVLPIQCLSFSVEEEPAMPWPAETASYATTYTPQGVSWPAETASYAISRLRRPCDPAAKPSRGAKLRSATEARPRTEAKPPQAKPLQMAD